MEKQSSIDLMTFNKEGAAFTSIEQVKSCSFVFACSFTFFVFMYNLLWTLFEKGIEFNMYTRLKT